MPLERPFAQTHCPAFEFYVLLSMNYFFRWKRADDVSCVSHAAAIANRTCARIRHPFHVKACHRFLPHPSVNQHVRVALTRGGQYQRPLHIACNANWNIHNKIHLYVRVEIIIRARSTYERTFAFVFSMCVPLSSTCV